MEAGERLRGGHADANRRELSGSRCARYGENPYVCGRHWRVQWGWVPAAIFMTVIGWGHYGWWLLLLVAVGLGIGVYGEWSGRKGCGA
jgi:hypothetical protein